jgi:uncharacterized protein (DUF302 family)
MIGTVAGQNTDTETPADEATPTTERTQTETPTPPADAGLVTVTSERDFAATVERITGDIEDSESLGLFTTVDHAANAEAAGLDLEPTTLVLFGNPAAGTPLMQAGRTAGIDLPQKLLVWADDGTVKVTYNDPQWLVDRHGIDGVAELVSNISATLETLATGESTATTGTATTGAATTDGDGSG